MVLGGLPLLTNHLPLSKLQVALCLLSSRPGCPVPWEGRMAFIPPIPGVMDPYLPCDRPWTANCSPFPRADSGQHWSHLG
jgi:hypothetical protein